MLCKSSFAASYVLPTTELLFAPTPLDTWFPGIMVFWQNNRDQMGSRIVWRIRSRACKQTFANRHLQPEIEGDADHIVGGFFAVQRPRGSICGFI